jgi:iron complex transport system substrate-binding protein
MRVISLLPGATDMVAAAGGAGLLVGVTHECDLPPGAPLVPRVTATVIADDAPGAVDERVRALSAEGAALFTLDAERIRALSCDLVITQALCDVCAVRETDVRALAASLSPVPAIVTLGATTLDGMLADLERVAAAIGSPREGEAAANTIRQRMLVVHERLRAAAAPRPAVAVVEWCDPVYAAGHWVPEMVRRAGGRDVIARPGQHSGVTTAGAIAAADPEVILVAPCGYDAARAADAAVALLAQPEWHWARKRRVWALDANRLTSRPGPRLADGIETIASILHPALFAAPAVGFARNISGH